MSIHNLVKMANDIGRFFASEPRRADAVAGIANHIQRSWDPRMLRQIVAHVHDGGEGLDDLPREAVGLLKVAPVDPRYAGSAGAACASGAAVSAAAGAAGKAAGGGSH